MQASAKQHEAYRHLLIDSKANAQALSFFGLAEKDLPAYIVHDAADGKDDKFVSKKAKPGSLDGFVGQFKACPALGCWHLRLLHWPLWLSKD